MNDNRYFFLIHQVQRKLQKFADRVYLKAIGISSVQVATIFFLKKNDGCLLKELSSGLHMNNSAVTGLVNRMERSGLILRKKSSGDGRAVQVFLTEKAQILAIQAVPILVKANEMMREDFSDAEMEVVTRFLNSIISFSTEEKEKLFQR